MNDSPNANATFGELVDREGRTLVSDSFSGTDDRDTRYARTATWDIDLDCASLPVSWAFGLLVAAEILRTRAM